MSETEKTADELLAEQHAAAYRAGLEAERDYYNSLGRANRAAAVQAEIDRVDGKRTAPAKGKAPRETAASSKPIETA